MEVWFYNSKVYQKQADGMADSVDSVQTVPLGAV